MSEGHAKYSPSGAKKWMTCPGSIAMEHDEPNEGSEYSDEGTAAHALAAMCLSEKKHPVAFLGRTLHVVNGVYQADYQPGQPGWGEQTVRSFEVDQDMCGYVNVYVQHIMEYAAGAEELLVEQRVPIGHITGEKGAAGTSDAVIFKGDELQVHDLKYGMGVKVFANENEQGIMYLLGALEEFAPVYGTPTRFRFVVHQPRLDHLDEWDCSYDELMAWKEKLTKGASLATIAFEHRVNWMGKDGELQYLNPGEHCKKAFCRARAKCPALEKMVADAVGADFDVLVEDTKETVAARVPTDLKALGQKFSVLDIVMDWCKAVRAKAEAALFEYHNSDDVQKALGLKLVQGKKGNRQWTDEKEVIAALKKMRLKTEDIFDLSVKTPPAIEKQLKDTPKRWDKVSALIKQADGQPSVTTLDDKRPPLVMTPVADQFDAVPDDGSDLV